jgi:hypothetical protein
MLGGELYVLARHHKMCKLVNWSRPSNITSCSRTPGHAHFMIGLHILRWPYGRTGHNNNNITNVNKMSLTYF